MVTIIIGGRRRPGMTHAEYSHYAQVRHGGLVRRDPGRLSSYVQSHVLDCAHGTGADGWHVAPDYDSFSELTFPDGEAFTASLQDEYFRSTIQPDETNFVTHDAIILLATRVEEQPVPRPAHGTLKVMRFLRGREGVARDDLVQAWRKETARLALHPDLSPHVRRLTRSECMGDVDGATLPRAFVAGTPLGDDLGVESLWFDRPDDLTAVARYREVIEEPDSHLNGMLDRRAELLFLAQEYRIVP